MNILNSKKTQWLPCGALFLVLVLLLPHSFAADAPVVSYTGIEWAKPDGFSLTLDIHVPDTGKKSYPVLVIYHGGGWLINNNSIMDSMARYVAAKGEYVVCNMNYRLLVDNGNTVTMNQIVEDVMGGLLWVKAHIAEYQGDPGRIAVTGDSAGGHLSAMVVNAGRQLESDGFAGDSLGFKPTWLPADKTAEQVAAADGLKVQAAVLSYGAFDLYAAANNGFEQPGNFFWQMGGAEARGLFGGEINAQSDPEYYQAVSPLYLIPDAKEYRLPPQFAHVGSADQTTPAVAVKAYVDALKEAGQGVDYTLYEGRKHAFLDSGCNEYLGSCFDQDAPAVLDDIIVFLDRHLK